MELLFVIVRVVGFFNFLQLLLEDEVDCSTLDKPGLQQLLADSPKLLLGVRLVDDPGELVQLKLLIQGEAHVLVVFRQVDSRVGRFRQCGHSRWIEGFVRGEHLAGRLLQ